MTCYFCMVPLHKCTYCHFSGTILWMSTFPYPTSSFFFSFLSGHASTEPERHKAPESLFPPEEHCCRPRIASPDVFHIKLWQSARVFDSEDKADLICKNYFWGRGRKGKKGSTSQLLTATEHLQTLNCFLHQLPDRCLHWDLNHGSLLCKVRTTKCQGHGGARARCSHQPPCQKFSRIPWIIFTTGEALAPEDARFSLHWAPSVSLLLECNTYKQWDMQHHT